MHLVDLFLGKRMGCSSWAGGEGEDMCAGPLTQCVRRTGLQGPFSCGDQDSADTEAFLSPFRRKYCPIVQTRILRLRETMSQGILSPEGEDQNVAQP